MATRENIGKGVNAPAASAKGDGLPVRSRSKEVQHVDRRSGTFDRRSGRSRGQQGRLGLRQAEVHDGQPSTPLDEPLLNADEAAQLLHVPRSTLYELVRSRRLPHVRVGRGLRFTRAELGRWVADNTVR